MSGFKWFFPPFSWVEKTSARIKRYITVAWLVIFLDSNKRQHYPNKSYTWSTDLVDLNLAGGTMWCDVMKVRPKSDGDVISSRLGKDFFFIGSSNRVKSIVSQRGVWLEIFGMIKHGCVSISSVKQIMYEWRRECEERCKGKWLKLEDPSWTAALSQRDVNLIPTLDLRPSRPPILSTHPLTTPLTISPTF